MWRQVILLGLVLARLPDPIFCQENEVTDDQPIGKKLEETVVKDMLRIVDHKFDTLTTRITALERAVSNLQFFSIRQFRQISGGLQTSENELKAVRKEVGQLESDGRGLKIAMTLLGRDVSALKKTSSDLLLELESSVVYINDHMDKQTQSIKEEMGEAVLRTSRETTTVLSRQMEEIVKKANESKPDPKYVNCSVDFSNLSEHIDLRFAEFRQQTHAHFVNMINAAKLDIRGKGKVVQKSKAASVESAESEEREESEEESEESDKDKKNSKTIKVRGNEVSSQNLEDPSAFVKKDVSHQGQEATSNTGDDDLQYQNENDARVMEALYNMTTSVLQAVSYFRNTGGLLEQILSNTEKLATEQADLTRKLGMVQLDGRPGGWESDSEEDERNTTYGPALSGIEGCFVSSEVIGNVATIIKNGSQLLEVLTDLAQMSSVSLTHATASLQDEITRVEGVRERMATVMLARANGDESDPVTQLTNTTQRTFKLVEAVASNTGWLPLIFHNVQHVETLTNRSLDLVTRNHALLRQTHAAATAYARRGERGRTRDENDPTISNRIPRIPGDVDSPAQSDLNSPSKDEAVLDRESLETIYSTSLQLNRIMPALTKLLAEPDPLITLVEGGRADQGRLEIYHKGQWGAVCHHELSHAEADVICRHLGFRGGISAGAGYFGPGAGVTWTLNTSCLATGHCGAVHYSEESGPCSHERDAAVICDHMLRIISSDGSGQGKAGRLEIHHRGMWMPVCGEGWSGYSARVACKQMGFTDGREMEVGEWLAGSNSTWLGKVACSGTETRLDACSTDGWTETCPGLAPAGVRCL